jgi:hypothetical protein
MSWTGCSGTGPMRRNATQTSWPASPSSAACWGPARQTGSGLGTSSTVPSSHRRSVGLPPFSTSAQEPASRESFSRWLAPTCKSRFWNRCYDGQRSSPRLWPSSACRLRLCGHAPTLSGGRSRWTMSLLAPSLRSSGWPHGLCRCAVRAVNSRRSRGRRPVPNSRRLNRRSGAWVPVRDESNTSGRAW